jgi:hypothetical protein
MVNSGPTTEVQLQHRSFRGTIVAVIRTASILVVIT